MSDAIFPDFAGLTWPVGKAPEYKTIIHEAKSGKEARAGLWVYPRYTLSLQFTVFQDNGAGGDFQKILGFFLARRGSLDDFLFLDKDDHHIEQQPFGTGDGSTKTFQLMKNYAGFTEPALGVVGSPMIYLDGSPASGYTVSTRGQATFNAAPASGKQLTWTGDYYYRVRFKEDLADFEQFAQKLWEAKTIELVTVK